MGTMSTLLLDKSKPRVFEFDVPGGGHWTVSTDGQGMGVISTEGLKAGCSYCGTEACQCPEGEEIDPDDDKTSHLYNAACDGIESLVLGCACAGIDVGSPQFVEALQAAVQAIAQEFPESDEGEDEEDEEDEDDEE